MSSSARTSRKRSSLLAGPTLILMALAASCSSATNNNSSSGTAAPTTASATTTTTTASPPTTAESTTTTISFIMPSLVGMDLQAAQDEIQRVSGDPFYITKSRDATGQGRHQILDRNWMVCSQNVAPGTRVEGDTDITFDVVRLTETCPTAATPTTVESTTTTVSFIMPNMVGMDLQAAQNEVQVLSGNPLYITRSRDATGRGRFQILDRNWKVCSQSVAPGTRVEGQMDITFEVVKLTEACP